MRYTPVDGVNQALFAWSFRQRDWPISTSMSLLNFKYALVICPIRSEEEFPNVCQCKFLVDSHRIEKHDCKMSTALRIPRRSPIQVLTQLNAA